MLILWISTLYLISGPVCCSDVVGYSRGSVLVFSDLPWDVNHFRYVCKVEESGCTNIMKDQTNNNEVNAGRFMMYSNIHEKFVLLIRELNPQDSGMYRFGVGSETHKDVELTVQTDSCCGRIEKMNANLGETATFTCNYPDEFKTNSKYLDNFNSQTTFEEIMYTEKDSQMEQKHRYSIFDDRRSKVFSVNISGVREDDGGVYLCGVWKNQSVGYFSYFKEIQLQVTDSCCGRIEKMDAYLGETATFTCNYPDELRTNNKSLTNLNNQTTVKEIMYTEKDSQMEQKHRYSIFDDRRSKVFSVNISGVREDDGGVYLCGVWRKDMSVGYYSYFKEIQLQVTAPGSSSSIIITVGVCVTLLLIGGLAVITYCVKRKKRQGSSSSTDNRQQAGSSCGL